MGENGNSQLITRRINPSTVRLCSPQATLRAGGQTLSVWRAVEQVTVEQKKTGVWKSTMMERGVFEDRVRWDYKKIECFSGGRLIK